MDSLEFEEARRRESSGNGSGEKWPLDSGNSDKAFDLNVGQQAEQIEQVAESLSPSANKRPPVRHSAPIPIPSPSRRTAKAPWEPTAAPSSLPSSSSSSSPQTACKLSERSFEAHKRSELCYWFRISEQLRRKINGSLVRTETSSSRRRERLVEAELHVFKLLPELLQNTRDQAHFAKNSNGVSTTMAAPNSAPNSSSTPQSGSSSSSGSNPELNPGRNPHSKWSELAARSRAKALNWPSSLMVNGSSLYARPENAGRSDIEIFRGDSRDAQRGIVKEAANLRDSEEKELESAKENPEEQARQVSLKRMALEDKWLLP